MKQKRDVIVVVSAVLFLAVIMLTVLPISSSTMGYDPWADITGPNGVPDGKIDMRDVSYVARLFGTKGTPLQEAAIQFDSGWMNITDMCGQYFNVTHNLNSQDIIVDIQGKTTLNSGTHERYLGLSSLTKGWTKELQLPSWVSSIVQTADGGYVAAGGGGGFLALKASVVKTDAFGNIVWNETYVSPVTEYVLSSIMQSEDSFLPSSYSYVAVGSLYSATNGYDVLLMKIDSDGTMAWSKAFGGTHDESAVSVMGGWNGGYAILGSTNSIGAGNNDFWLIQTDLNGNMEWNKTYGGSANDNAVCGLSTVDGGYMLAGNTWSFGSNSLFWLVKTDINGTVQWSRTFGDISHNNTLTSIIQTNDGGYAITGYTDMNSSYTACLTKTDSLGNITWQKTWPKGGIFDLCPYRQATAVVQTTEGGYAITFDARTSYLPLTSISYVLKLDPNGNYQWESSLYDIDGYPSAVIQTNDGALLILEGAKGMLLLPPYTSHIIKTDVENGLAWVDSSPNTITLYRGATDPYWNFVRVQIWKTR